MKSPFPGMDPYLEARWSDVHPTLITALKEALQPTLPRDLRARSEERVLLEDVEGDVRRYRNDVAIVELPSRAGGLATVITGPLTTLEPFVIDIPEGTPYHRSVQIIDLSSGNRVVTAIEVLSP